MYNSTCCFRLDDDYYWRPEARRGTVDIDTLKNRGRSVPPVGRPSAAVSATLYVYAKVCTCVCTSESARTRYPQCVRSSDTGVHELTRHGHTAASVTCKLYAHLAAQRACDDTRGRPLGPSTTHPPVAPGRQRRSSSSSNAIT